MFEMMDDPPYEMNGSVIPVHGITPMVIPMFSNIWNTNIPMKPTTMRAPNRSADLWHVRADLYMNRP